MTARDLRVIARRTASGFIQSVSVSTSTRTGVAPEYATALAVATKVRSGTMTSCPGPMLSASIAKCNAVVPLLVATANSTPQYCGVEFAVATSNGTTALHLAIEALSIGPGHEVIVPDLTFVATANAVAYSGATPVLVDVDTDTLCINPEAVRRAITPKSRAVIPVHLYGHPAEMEEINAIAAEFDLFVIEDAAEAHGAEFRGKRVGGLSNCGVLSFYGNKSITTGEGGISTTKDASLYQRARSRREDA